MSFSPNQYQQLRLDDKFNFLSGREKRILENSWAKGFADIIFPAIHEERFAVLYSTHSFSRPNTPVNVVVSALLLKEMCGLYENEEVWKMKMRKILLYLINIIIILLTLSSFFIAVLVLYSKFVTNFSIGIMGHMGWIDILLLFIGIPAFIFYYKLKNRIMMMISVVLLLSQLFLQVFAR